MECNLKLHYTYTLKNEHNQEIKRVGVYGELKVACARWEKVFRICQIKKSTGFPVLLESRLSNDNVSVLVNADICASTASRSESHFTLN